MLYRDRYRKITPDKIRTAAHLALSREVARKSLVLLENRNKTLPLAGSGMKRKISVVGPFADCQSCCKITSNQENLRSPFSFLRWIACV